MIEREGKIKSTREMKLKTLVITKLKPRSQAFLSMMNMKIEYYCL
jgi:hypothetical protein